MSTSKLIYMKEYLNTFSQEKIKELIDLGELKKTEIEEPYILIVEED